MDREKVIKGLDRCSKHDGSECPQCPYFNSECTDDLMADALSLLKEQEEKIKTLHIAQNVIADYLQQPEIVRCKDCKWWHESETHKGYGDCGQANGITLKSSDWFCADGERK